MPNTDGLDSPVVRLDDDGIINHMGTALSMLLAVVAKMNDYLPSPRSHQEALDRGRYITGVLNQANSILNHAKSEMEIRAMEDDQSGDNVLEH